MILKKDLKLNWEKTNGLIPVIVQHFESAEVLMHAYMNEIALKKTILDGEITFFSRSKMRLWKKGETSGNFLKVIDIIEDCDKDTLLILADPISSTCHTGNNSCFNFKNKQPSWTFLLYLENLLKSRKKFVKKASYTYDLYKKGTKRIAQKVGEEAVETILASTSKNKQEIINESADLFYHLLILLQKKELNFNMIINKLKERHNFCKF